VRTYEFNADLELRHVEHEDRIAVYHERKMADNIYFAPAVALVLSNNKYVVASFSQTLHCTNAESFKDCQKAWKFFDTLKREMQRASIRVECKSCSFESAEFYPDREHTTFYDPVGTCPDCDEPVYSRTLTTFVQRAVLQFTKDVFLEVNPKPPCKWYAKGQTIFVTILEQSDEDFLAVRCEHDDQERTLPRKSIDILWQQDFEVEYRLA